MVIKARIKTLWYDSEMLSVYIYKTTIHSHEILYSEKPA